MGIRPKEVCTACDRPTGKAGRADDSLYCETCERGPFCPECFGEDWDCKACEAGNPMNVRRRTEMTTEPMERIASLANDYLAACLREIAERGEWEPGDELFLEEAARRLEADDE